MPYTRSQASQAKRQRTASVAKRIPTALLTNILEMKHEMEVAEWREEHKQQFSFVLNTIGRVVLVWNTTGDGSFMGWLIRGLPASWYTRFGPSRLVFHPPRTFWLHNKTNRFFIKE